MVLVFPPIQGDGGSHDTLCSQPSIRVASGTHPRTRLAAKAKVGRGDRAWRTATIGYYTKGAMVRSSLRRCGRDGGVNTLPTWATSCLLQARLHQETIEHWTLCFQVFLQLVAEVLGDLSEAFVQGIGSVAKGWRPATENARRATLPHARPIGDIMHMWARFRQQLPKMCQEDLSQEPTAASSKTHEWQIRRGMTALCDFAPTLEIMDAVLRCFFGNCADSLGEKEAVKYLYDQECVHESSQHTAAQRRIPIHGHLQTTYLFAVAWQGLFCDYPWYKARESATGESSLEVGQGLQEYGVYG